MRFSLGNSPDAAGRSHVGATLDALAGKDPDRAAVSDGRETLTRSELLRRVQAMQAGLASARAPQRVLVATADAVPALCRLLAAARSGRAAVVVDPTHLQRYGDAIRDALAPLMVEWPVALEKDRQGNAGAGVPGETSPRPEAPFYIGLTSGSTGRPKAFQRSHRSWIESFRLAGAAFALDADERVFVPGGLGHSLHLFGAAHALHQGWRVDIARGFQPAAVMRRMQAAGSTVLVATPTQLRLLARAGERDGLRLACLRRILISGAKWHERDRDRVAAVFPQAECHEFYGTSETSFISHRGPADAYSEGVGRPFPGVEVEVCGAGGDRLAEGMEGEIWVRSPLLFDGYVMGDEPMTRSADGWLTVGDRGHLDSAGRLHLAGRGGRMIVTSGLNVFAEEIEAVLMEHAGVLQAAVFGVADGLRGARIVAALQAGAEVDPGALRRHCLLRLERAKVPLRFHILDDWPLTPGGKSDLPAIEAVVSKREEAADAGVSRRRET